MKNIAYFGLKSFLLVILVVMQLAPQATAGQEMCQLRPLANLENPRADDEMRGKKEYLAVMNMSGQRTGDFVLKNQAHKDGTPHPNFAALVFSSDGKRMLFQVRSEFRDFYPGLKDVAIAGHGRAGEAPAQNLGREVNEEFIQTTGVRLDPKRFKQIGREDEYFGLYQKYTINDVDYYIFLSEDPSGQEYPILCCKPDVKGPLLEVLKGELNGYAGEARSRIERFMAAHKRDLVEYNREFKTLYVYVLTPEEEAALIAKQKTLGEELAGAAEKYRRGEGDGPPEMAGFEFGDFEIFVGQFKDLSQRFYQDGYEPYFSRPKVVKLIKVAIKAGIIENNTMEIYDLTGMDKGSLNYLMGALEVKFWINLTAKDENEIINNNTISLKTLTAMIMSKKRGSSEADIARQVKEVLAECHIETRFSRLVRRAQETNLVAAAARDQFLKADKDLKVAEGYRDRMGQLVAYEIDVKGAAVFLSLLEEKLGVETDLILNTVIDRVELEGAILLNDLALSFESAGSEEQVVQKMQEILVGLKGVRKIKDLSRITKLATDRFENAKEAYRRTKLVFERADEVAEAFERDAALIQMETALLSAI